MLKSKFLCTFAGSLNNALYCETVVGIDYYNGKARK